MADTIHILQIAKSSGGVGEYVRWLAEGIDKSRFRLTVACLSEGGPEFAAQLNLLPGVRAESFGMNRYQIAPHTDAITLANLAGLIRRERPDLIHAHTSKPGFLGRIAALGSGVPVIYTAHGFAFHDRISRAKRVAYATLERLAAATMTTKIVAVSDAERQMGLRFGVGRPDQILTVHTGIDLAPFDVAADRSALRASLGVPADAPLVGVVGRLIAQKAPLDFVRAVGIIHRARPDARFVWLGGGPLKQEAENAARAAGIDGVINFAGQRRDIPALLQTLDVFVLPSLWESFSLVLLEAMAARLPVVATSVDGNPEAVADGETGLIVPPSTPDALARGILRLLEDPALAHAMGQAGRQRVEREFNRERMLANIGQVYEDLYARNQRGVAVTSH
jgi:glycosyltransferase involved in cell wall biosynthesis